MSDEQRHYQQLIDAWVQADRKTRAAAMNRAGVGIDQIRDEPDDKYARRQFGLAARAGRLDKLWHHLAAEGHLQGELPDAVALDQLHDDANRDLDQRDLAEAQEEERGRNNPRGANADRPNADRDPGASGRRPRDDNSGGQRDAGGRPEGSGQP